MSRWRFILALAAMAMSPSAAFANAYCDGYANEVYMQSDGTVSIWSTWRLSYTFLCNVNAAWKGVPSETCRHWYATLNLAVAEEQPIRVYYDDPVTSCSTLPEYGLAPGPTYVMMKK